MDFCGVQTRYENVCNHNLLFWGLFELGLPDGKVWSGGGGGGGREGPKRALSLPQILQRVLRLFSDIYEMVLLREEHLVDVRKSVNIGHLRDENHLIDVHLTEMWAPKPNHTLRANATTRRKSAMARKGLKLRLLISGYKI